MLVLIAGLVAVRVPLPLLVMEPGPTTNVAKLIQIQAPTFSSKGSFLLTTALVSSTEGVTLADAALVILDPDKDLIPREAIFPSNSTRVNTDRVHAAQMTESQQVAAVAALHELGMTSTPDGAFIREVANDAPAAGKLMPGDVIVSVEQTPVRGPTDLLGALGKRKAGEEVTVGVERDGTTKQFSVKTTRGPEKRNARLGVLVIPKHKLPIDISIDAGNIGGPSAGLVFALAIYDALTPGDLTGGRQIAGTGSLSNDEASFGKVRAVGAVGEKVKAAGQKGVDVFFVPKGNLEEARAASEEGMRIVAVSTLHEAIKALGR